MEKPREVWVDAVKIVACVLVAVGHFFQSMVTSRILQEGAFLKAFDQSIYTFHVPLFFICSGYLYQKNTIIDSFSAWGRNLMRKLLTLGVPYLFFSVATWLLKNVFSGSVNAQTEGIFRTLLLEPFSPYWYLYCLFLFFFLIPAFRNKKQALIVAVISFASQIVSWNNVGYFYALKIVLEYAIWFVLGMLVKTYEITKFFEKKGTFTAGAAASFVFLLYVFFREGRWNGLERFCAGIAACVGVIFVFGYLFRKNRESGWLQKISKYTMPVFLMHTLFAAGLRVVLLKLGVRNAVVHICLGLSISFIGPVVAAEVLNHIKWTAWILHPEKLLKK